MESVKAWMVLIVVGTEEWREHMLASSPHKAISLGLGVPIMKSEDCCTIPKLQGGVWNLVNNGSDWVFGARYPRRHENSGIIWLVVW